MAGARWWLPYALLPVGWVPLVALGLYLDARSLVLILGVPLTLFTGSLTATRARRHGWRHMVVGLVATVTVAAATLLPQWSAVYARVYFALHRADFAGAATLVESPGWMDVIPRERRELPDPLDDLSTTGDIYTVGYDRAHPAWFLNRSKDDPEYARGFVHLDGDPDQQIDLHGFPVHPSFELGDGWWWVQSH
ncbi:hypothetical protein [Actinokineospora enzanensis]|uniref:hypothetical protein n=1 Tax=Actinokineospora enzanensis TaxID=155975 RepID=UPI00037D57A9|nr:hypothetical protein [Actinokineospora enzanensis]